MATVSSKISLLVSSDAASKQVLADLLLESNKS